MLKSPKVVIVSFLLSLVIWVTESSCLLIVAAACGVEIHLLGAIFTVIIIGIGAIIPTAPGYIGAFEFMGVTALAALGIEKDNAFATIALYHVMQIIIICALGFFSVLKAKLSFADLFRFQEIRSE